MGVTVIWTRQPDCYLFIIFKLLNNDMCEHIIIHNIVLCFYCIHNLIIYTYSSFWFCNCLYHANCSCFSKNEPDFYRKLKLLFVWNIRKLSQGYLQTFQKYTLCLYIYIYLYRERERRWWTANETQFIFVECP